VNVGTIGHGSCLHVGELTAVPVNNLVVIAFLYETPLLIVLEVGAVPLIDIAAVGCGPVLHLQAHTAVSVDYLVITTISVLYLPLLVLAARVVPLLHVGTIGCGGISHLQGLAAVAGENLIPHACRRCLTWWRILGRYNYEVFAGGYSRIRITPETLAIGPYLKTKFQSVQIP